MFSCTCKYYNRRRNALLAGVWLLAGGCAGPNQVARGAPTLPFEQLQTQRSPELVQRLQHLPYIVKFSKGQAVPVDFTLDSIVFEVRDEDFVIVAKRDFYLLFREGGPPLLSLDGVEFEDRPRNYFRFGFKMYKNEPTVIDFALGVRPQNAP